MKTPPKRIIKWFYDVKPHGGTLMSEMIYELLNFEGRKIEETFLEKLGFSSPVPFIEIKKYALENDLNFIGFIKPDSTAHLAPRNDERVELDYRLIFVQ